MAFVLPFVPIAASALSTITTGAAITYVTGAITALGAITSAGFLSTTVVLDAKLTAKQNAAEEELERERKESECMAGEDQSSAILRDRRKRIRERFLRMRQRLSRKVKSSINHVVEKTSQAKKGLSKRALVAATALWHAAKTCMPKIECKGTGDLFSGWFHFHTHTHIENAHVRIPVTPSLLAWNTTNNNSSNES